MIAIPAPNSAASLSLISASRWTRGTTHKTRVVSGGHGSRLREIGVVSQNFSKLSHFQKCNKHVVVIGALSDRSNGLN